MDIYFQLFCFLALEDNVSFYEKVALCRSFCRYFCRIGCFLVSFCLLFFIWGWGICTFNVSCMHGLACWEESFHFFGVWSGFIWGLSGFIWDSLGISWDHGLHGVSLYLHVFISDFILFNCCVSCLFCLFRVRWTDSERWGSGVQSGGRWRFCGFRWGRHFVSIRTLTTPRYYTSINLLTFTSFPWLRR